MGEGRIAEIELQIIQIDRAFTAEVAKELADKIPDKLKALSAACDQYAQDVGVMPAE